MTAAAWVTLALTWAVIGYFTIRFFVKVVRAPQRDETD
jgi:hypothetical protein